MSAALASRHQHVPRRDVPTLAQGEQQILLGGEVHIDAGRGQAGSRGDVSGRCRVETLVGERVCRSLHEAQGGVAHDATPGEAGSSGSRAPAYGRTVGTGAFMVDSMHPPRETKQALTHSVSTRAHRRGRHAPHHLQPGARGLPPVGPRVRRATLKPRAEQMVEAKSIDRSLWKEAGKLGLFGLEIPEEFGGVGADDYRFNAVAAEEIAGFNAAVSSCFGIHSDVCPPYVVDLGTEEQKQRWLPGMASGDLICAIAMTEPSGGSDLAALRTNAVRDGDSWVLNGSKTFITNGYQARPGHRRGAHRPEQGRQGDHPVHGRDRHGRLHPRPQAGQGRPGGDRHRRAVLRRTSGCRTRTGSARRTWASSR